MRPHDEPAVLPFRVGIKPEAPAPTPKPAPKLILSGSAAGKTFGDEVEVGMDQPQLRPRLALLGADGNPIGDTSAAPDLIHGATGETLTSLTWDGFLAWRKTKTKPRDLAVYIEPGRESYDDADREAYPGQDWLVEIDQAVLELIGEVAELAEIFAKNGPLAFWGNLRDKLIDECGDVLFCAAWALDAWGRNPFVGATDLELIRVADDDQLALFARALASNQPADVLPDPRFTAALGGMILQLMLTMQTNAGLLANSFKKLRYQRRKQDVDAQAARIINTMLVANQLLILANSSVEEALKANQRKLDARFPEGYKPGVGGGIRTGQGA